MKLRLLRGLPFVSAALSYRGQAITLDQVLVDTGSASTLFCIDSLKTIGLQMDPADALRRIRGVGGTEFVFSKPLDHLVVGNLRADGFVIQVGAMEYGFTLDGILGADFLLQTRAKINFNRLTLR